MRFAKEDFTLRAMLLCTINDFPAYGNLSGYSVKGKKACPICDDATVAPRLTYSRKNVYTGHRRFLSRYHPYRRMKKAFNGENESGMAPIPLEGDEVYEQVKDISVVFGKPNKFEKNAKYKKKSIFWNLPYWKHMSVRHCIDIMHVEKNVAESLIGTRLTFRERLKMATSKVIDPDTLDKLQADIVETLCQFEMYFPPSFFDISVHLVVHLVREAKLLGPVHLRDMYAFERYMGVLKGYTTNRYRPDASIVEGYIAAESRHEGRLEGKGTIGAKWVSLKSQELNDAHFLVLQHLTEAHPYIEEHMRILKLKYPKKNYKWLVEEHNRSFVKWFRVKVLDELSCTPNEVGETVKWLAYGPNTEVKSYEGYDINGYCFYTKRQDNKSTMQNSGVTLVASSTEFSSGTPTCNQMSYYGIIEDIWELQYTTFMIPLFKCKWAENKKGVRVDEYGFTLVDFSTQGYKNEPLIMASQAKQVFYISDPANDKWCVVLQGKRRILGVDNVVDEEEYDEFDDIPPFSEGLPSMPVEDNLETNYVRVDHNEGIWEDRDQAGN
ncbi:uncharacterized protein LOC141631892 [Silene latifolia]|uniref:uncharacterized protein LOC141631892 n=1 Tax=Silene latifolia TaxID=37657 RepID=UPI003D77BF5F